MNVRELLQKTRNILQDQEKNFWDDSELLDYYEEGRRIIASNRNGKLKTQDVLLVSGTKLYEPDGVLRYVSCVDDEANERTLYPNDGSGDEDSYGITIIDYDQVKVNDETIGTTLTFTYLGLPVDHNLNDTVRQGDETALRFYICARAYEKETDLENFAKSESFQKKFDQALDSLIKDSSVSYDESKIGETKSYFF